MDKIAVKAAGTPMTVVVVFARYSALVIDTDDLRLLSRGQVSFGGIDELLQTLKISLMLQTDRDKGKMRVLRHLLTLHLIILFNSSQIGGDFSLDF